MSTAQEMSRLLQALIGLPALYSSEGKDIADAACVYVFMPVGSARWVLWEYDPVDNIAFGLCDLGTPEIGYVDVRELLEVRDPIFGLSAEVDKSVGTVADGYRLAGVEMPAYLTRRGAVHLDG